MHHSKANIQRELNKLLASSTFHSSERRRNFLRYLVDKTIKGQADELKEYTIGLEFFERGDSFDPRLDNVVRTEARRLRETLSRYYEEEGRDDPLRIEMAKGSYAISFHGRAPVGTPPPAMEQQSSPELPAILSPQPIIEDKTPQDSAVRPGRTAKFAIIATLAVLGIAIGIYIFLSKQQKTPAASNEGQPSVAVLPFKNLGPNAEDDTFSDGLTEELIDALAKIPGLRVVARSSVFQFKEKSIDLRQIGKELGVRTVIEGSIRQSGDRVRITVLLADAANGFNLWSQTYDREAADILKTEAEIAKAVADALGVQLAGVIPQRAESKVDPAVYRDYLRGRFLLQTVNADNVEQAIKLFNKAIASDPKYAPAYAGLAGCYAALPRVSDILPVEAYAKVKEFATRALEIDRSYGLAHAYLGQAAMYNQENATAQKEFARALELSPGDAMVHHWYGSYLARINKPAESLAQRQIAASLDPLNLFMMRSVGMGYFYDGRWDEAIAQLETALAIDPKRNELTYRLATANVLKGDCVAALKLLPQDVQDVRTQNITNTGIGYVYAACGEKAKAQQLLARLLEQAKGKRFSAVQIAQTYIGLGEKDKAIEWLEKAVERREEEIFLSCTAVYNPLRSDPRFQALVNRVEK